MNNDPLTMTDAEQDAELEINQQVLYIASKYKLSHYELVNILELITKKHIELKQLELHAIKKQNNPEKRYM